MKTGQLWREGASPTPCLMVADLWWSRLRGLLFRPPLARDGSEAMAIQPCASIHTFWMTYPLDIVFLDRQGRVRGWRENLRPWRVAACRGAFTVVEFHAGALAGVGLKAGQQWRMILDDEAKMEA